MSNFVPFPSTGARQATATDLNAAFAAVANDSATTNQFYQDVGANVRRFADRVLMGAAAENQALSARDTTPTDWLSTLMSTTSIGAYATHGAQVAALSRFGTIGLLTASRTSDAKAHAGILGYTPASIGHASWGISDDTSSPTSTTAWAFYAEVWRMPGASYQPGFGHEIECVNFGGLPVGVSTPYNPNVGGGLYGIQFGAGGGQTAGTSDAAAVFTVVRNPNGFQKGMVFKSDALTGATGTISDTGYAAAFSLGRNQAIEWYSPDGNNGFFIRSTVTQAAKASRLEAQDIGVVISNNVGQVVCIIETAAAPTAYPVLQTGSGTGSGASSMGLYVGGGGGSNPNLGLFPASGGEIQTQGPVTNGGGAIPATALGGFLHINVNGQDVRIPLLTPAQAGA